MTTSESERRTVAERLRAAAKTESASADYLWHRLEFAVNGWKYGDVIDESYVFDNGVLSRLADLIDPTCHLWPSHDGGFGCDRCFTWFPEMKAKTSYCPACGARVVSGDGE